MKSLLLSRFARAFLVVSIIGPLLNCGLVINQPADKGNVPCNKVSSPVCSVSATVNWQPSGASMSSFHATLDGTDQTAAFSINNAGQQATATFNNVPIGQHSLVVSGSVDYIFTINSNQTSQFTVQPLIQ